jgi:hypothetical protein
MSWWQFPACYIVIAIVVLFIITLYSNPENEEEFVHYCLALCWPVTFTFLAVFAAFFVLFILPARAAKWCHKRTTPPEAP